jgi:hypothetical protein
MNKEKLIEDLEDAQSKRGLSAKNSKIKGIILNVREGDYES